MPITPLFSPSTDYLIEECFVSGLRATIGAHLDAVQVYPAGGTVNNMTVRHNWLEAIDNSGNGVLANAAFFCSNGTYGGTVTVENNYLNATGFWTLRLYTATPTSGHIIRSNRWGRAGGPPCDLFRFTPAIWTDNKYLDNGEVINQPPIRTVEQ